MVFKDLQLLIHIMGVVVWGKGCHCHCSRIILPLDILGYISVCVCIYNNIILCRLHDRKMCIIGLSLLMDLSSRPAVLEGVASQIIPSILLLFLGLKHIYASRVLNKPEQFSRTQGTEEDENGKSLT